MKIQYLIVLLALFTNSAHCQEFTSKIIPLSTATQDQMLRLNIYTEDCPVALSRLKEVNFSYYDFTGARHNDGSLVVLDAVAENVVKIMHELYKIKFPINKSKGVELYNGDDDLSMQDNNSSAFNCRAVTNKPGVYSVHSYGLAIDINPIQNPYVGKFNIENNTATVLPSAGLNYLNRANLRAGMLEPVIHIFRKYGFSVWGGDWDDRIDWQHLQTSRPAANLLAAMTPEDAKEFFAMYTENPAVFNKQPEDDLKYVTLYKKSPKKCMLLLRKHLLIQ